MRKLLVILFTLIINFNTYCQVSKEDITIETKPLKEKIQSLQSENNKLKRDISSINSKVATVNQKLETLDQKVQSNASDIQNTNSELNGKITNSKTTTNQKFTQVDNSLSKNSFWSIIGILGAIIVSGLVYWLVSKRQRMDKNQLSIIIKSTKTELTQESARLDIQLLDVIEKQLKVADKLNATEPAVDHTSHKNSAKELQRIANYANTLDPESQESIALQGSLGRLKNYFNSSDYEITDFTGKDYDERIPMKIKDTFFEEALTKGSEIISRTLKPQIKFKGDVIQKAEVSTKYNN